MSDRRHLREATKYTIRCLISSFEAVSRAIHPQEPTIYIDMPGTVASGTFKRLCLFAHFDRDNVIDDYVVHHLARLHDLGCEIVFVSTAEGLSREQLLKIVPHTRRIIVRRNIGYDFGSWKIGMQHVDDIGRFEKLIIANDSVYGPLQDLSNIFAHMEVKELDFWGITDSLRYRHHLQSYFFVFDRLVMKSKKFQQFWKEMPFYTTKNAVILRCEVGLTRVLVRAGFRFGAFCSYDELLSDHAESVTKYEAQFCEDLPADPTRLLWRLLIQQYGCPFIKVALLRDQDAAGETVDDWRTVIDESANYDSRLIEHHLARAAN